MLSRAFGRWAVLTALTAVTPLQAAVSQAFEYGSPTELQGALWIYVETGSDLEVRQNILKTIQKDLPFLQVASAPAEADAVLVFGANAYTRYYGTINNSTTTGGANCAASAYGVGNYAYGQANCYGSANTQSSSTPLYGNVIDGKGWVIIVPDQGKPRLIHEYSDTRTSIFERRPSSNFARDFVKRYRAANPAPPAYRPPRSTRTLAQQADSSALTPEQAVFVEKARGVLLGLGDSLKLEPEWRAALARQAVPTLENLFKADPRASTADIADASRPAVGQVLRMRGQYVERLAPRAGECRSFLATKGVNVSRFDATYRNAASFFLASTVDLTDEGVSQFLKLCKENLPQLLAAAPTN
jgi:hypothetical protein